MAVHSAIIPCLVYENAPRAIDFLCRAFGFTRHAVFGEGDVVHHAQLMLGGNLIMLSSANEATEREFAMVPMTRAKASPMCICVVLDDPDSHYATAAKEGALIIRSPHDNDYGGRSYEARDDEGVVWSFGNYDPFAQVASGA